MNRDPAPHEPGVPLVVRVDYQGGVAEHGLRPCGEDLGEVFAVRSRSPAVDKGVAQAVKLAVHVLVVDF
jgi:hypothetical protein